MDCGQEIASIIRCKSGKESGNKIVVLVVWLMSIEYAGHNKSQNYIVSVCMCKRVRRAHACAKTACEPIEKVKYHTKN